MTLLDLTKFLGLIFSLSVCFLIARTAWMLPSSAPLSMRGSTILIALGLLAVSSTSAIIAMQSDLGPETVGAAALPIALALLAGLAGAGHLYFKQLHRNSGSGLGRSVRGDALLISDLTEAKADLENRLSETDRKLHEQQRRFAVALRDSPMMVAMYDIEHRYRWVYNPPEGVNAADLIGRGDDVILPEPAVTQMKMERDRVLETGEEREFELIVQAGGGGRSARYFKISIEPYYGRCGRLEGLLSVSVETTRERAREEQMRSALLELSHRTKNQLATLISLSRRLKARHAGIDDYAEELEAKMRALSACQDVLVAENWAAPALVDVVDAVWRQYPGEPVFNVEGSDGKGGLLRIEPSAVQNFGLVLDEILFRETHEGVADGPEFSARLLKQADGQCCGELEVEVKWETSGRGGDRSAATVSGDDASVRAAPDVQLELASLISRSAFGSDIAMSSTGMAGRGTTYSFSLPKSVWTIS